MIFRGKGGDFFFFFFFCMDCPCSYVDSFQQPAPKLSISYVMTRGHCLLRAAVCWPRAWFLVSNSPERGIILSIFLHLCSPLLFNVHNKTGWSCYRKTPNNLLYWLAQWRGWLGHGDSKLILFLAASARAQEMWEQAVNHTCCCTSEYLTLGWWGGDWRTGLGKASTALWSRVRAGKILMEQGCWKFFMEMRKGW